LKYVVRISMVFLYLIITDNFLNLAPCLAERCLESEGHLEEKVFPVSGRCPRCAVDFLWGDVVRDLRALLLIQDSKPMHEGMKIADGLIPKKIIRS